MTHGEFLVHFIGQAVNNTLICTCEGQEKQKDTVYVLTIDHVTISRLLLKDVLFKIEMKLAL